MARTKYVALRGFNYKGNQACAKEERVDAGQDVPDDFTQAELKRLVKRGVIATKTATDRARKT